MGRSDPGPKTYKDSSGDSKIKDKYKTELIIRPKNKDIINQVYNTTAGDKLALRNISVKGAELDQDCSSQFDYIRNNLCIKSCLGDREVLRFQMKKVSIRNYTPKILNQEINMGMWM